MINYTCHRTVVAFLLAVVFALAACGIDKPHSPPKQQIQNAVAAVLPPSLTLHAIDLESIPTGPDEVKVNFKAAVMPKEDLYQVARQVEGTPKVTLLQVVQPAGSKASLFGSVAARRTMDQWAIDPPQIEIGLRQFGAPRAAFDAQSYLAGSNEANEALKEQAANAEKLARAKEEARMEREKERKALEEQQAREDEARQKREEQAKVELEKKRQKEIAQRKIEEEQRQKEEDAAHQKLVLATVPGTRYIGTISYIGKSRRLRLVFGQEKGMIEVEASDPDSPGLKRLFGGELLSNPKPGEHGEVYPFLLAPAGRGTGDYHSFPFDSFYGSDGSPLRLRLTDTGLEGDQGGHVIRLQHER